MSNSTPAQTLDSPTRLTIGTCSSDWPFDSNILPAPNAGWPFSDRHFLFLHRVGIKSHLDFRLTGSVIRWIHRETMCLVPFGFRPTPLGRNAHPGRSRRQRFALHDQR